MSGKKKGMKENLIYQMTYQVIMLVIPLVLSPYLTRTLHADALGVYSFSHSIAYYFVIFAMLGISRYGQRTIALNQDKEIQLRKTFWSLYAVHAGMSICSLFAYGLFLVLIQPANLTIYMIQGLYVLSALFDVTWLFYGLEKFKSVLVRNFIVKVLEVTLILVFVKKPDDLWKYTLIMATSVLMGQLVMVPKAMYALKPIAISWEDAKIHIAPLFTLWLSVLAVTLYTVFNKTLLGLMSEKSNVAYYEYADKLVRVPVTIMGTIGTVTYPRMCKLVTEKDRENEREVIFCCSTILTAFLGFGAVSVFTSVGKSFVTLYYGFGFLKSAGVMIALSPIIILISLGDVLRTQIMIPRKKDKEYVSCICINAMVNIALSVAFIPVLGIYGAVMGTLAAELTGLFLACYVCRSYFSMRAFLSNVMPFAAASAIVIGFSYNANRMSFVSPTITDLLVNVAIAVSFYVILSAALLWGLKKEEIRTWLKK